MSQNKNGVSTPYVSIVMPMRNEEKFIARCVDSIMNNDYPHDKYELIVVDGVSTDGSRTIVQHYAQQYSNIRLLNNTKKIRVSANNIGIRAAKGEIIISMDSHVIYARDYIRRCVELLQTSGAANVGGLQRAVGNNYITDVIAIATTTPFGIGDAEFRYLEKEKWVDTVYLGAWYKRTLEEIGLFNEEWVRNGDYELNYRIRKAGGKILLSPQIKCKYFVRGSLAKLAKQYFLYGMWRVKTITTHPDSVRWRHLLPPALILWLLLSLMLGLLTARLWWIPIVSYIAYSVTVSLSLAIVNKVKFFLLLIPTLWVLHICWGTGFLFGIAKFGFPKISLMMIIRDLFGKSVL